MLNRRTFLMNSAALGAGLALGAQTSRAVPPSGRIRLGMIGTGNQGLNNLRIFLKKADIVALADVDSTRVSGAQKIVSLTGAKSPEGYSDFRKLLDRKDIDGVVVTTPDHWHAMMTTLACQAGKDVYCEKPLTLTVAEGHTMVAAARHNKRVVQTGSQQRSAKEFRQACELIRSGALGKLTGIKVGIPDVNFKGPAVADSTPPPELDYEFWLGPAPKKPYNEKHVHYLFRFFWDYSGGQLTNFGAHHLDIVQWALGKDESGPVAIEGTAQYHKQHWYEVPEKFDITYTYDDGLKVVCGQKYKGGVTFEGTKGTLFVNRGKLESKPVEILKTEPTEHLYDSKDHAGNWLDCIKSRKAPICDVAIGHRSATVCHLGNIAVRTGRKLTWDPVKQTIVGDSEAASMLARPYRAPWSLPEIA